MDANAKGPTTKAERSDMLAFMDARTSRRGWKKEAFIRRLMEQVDTLEQLLEKARTGDGDFGSKDCDCPPCLILDETR